MAKELQEEINKLGHDEVLEADKKKQEKIKHKDK